MAVSKLDQYDLTALINRAGAGDAEAEQQLMPLLYGELKRLASSHLRSKWNVTLSATGLVHEAFLRVAVLKDPQFANRAHFFGIASRIMRNVLVEMIRKANASKRGGGALTIQLDDAGDAGARRPADLLRLDDALSALAELHPRQAQTIEMKYFGGMTVAEIAEFLQVSESTVDRDLRFAEAWLRRQLVVS
ncbi:MAG: sigma-70 family RNA polymerase sigma factor [Bryobacterales bacterium]|nr:sigma-70 family RNA polymerase sigma factor [Bryobacterales bacterium]